MEEKSETEKEIKEREREEKFDFIGVIKENQEFPRKFKTAKKLKKVMDYYNKHWTKGMNMSDDESENEGDDDSDR